MVAGSSLEPCLEALLSGFPDTHVGLPFLSRQRRCYFQTHGWEADCRDDAVAGGFSGDVLCE